ncbi:hypothetical protein FACS1894186_7900 [Alphaproteobacteria bacterium]|nr:hypothetical protein FACS1894186_7900 [Alphaproteobacteria bacterium]
MVIPPGGRAVVPTGIKAQLADADGDLAEIQLRARSGLAAKNGLMLANGVGTVDFNYTGEIGAIVCNAGAEPFTVERGMRICQMVVCPIFKPTVEEISADELDATNRGASGFGSSGVK